MRRSQVSARTSRAAPRVARSTTACWRSSPATIGDGRRNVEAARPEPRRLVFRLSGARTLWCSNGLAGQPGDGERLRAGREVRVHDEEQLADAGDGRRTAERGVGARALELGAGLAAAQLEDADLRGTALHDEQPAAVEEEAVAARHGRSVDLRDLPRCRGVTDADLEELARVRLDDDQPVGVLGHDAVEVEPCLVLDLGRDRDLLRRAGAGLHLRPGHVPEDRAERVRDVDVAVGHDEVVQEPAGAGRERGDLLLGGDVVDRDRPRCAAGDVQLASGDLHPDGRLACRAGDELEDGAAVRGAAVDRPVAGRTDEEGLAAGRRDTLRVAVRRRREREHRRRLRVLLPVVFLAAAVVGERCRAGHQGDDPCQQHEPLKSPHVVPSLFSRLSSANVRFAVGQLTACQGAPSQVPFPAPTTRTARPPGSCMRDAAVGCPTGEAAAGEIGSADADRQAGAAGQRHQPGLPGPRQGARARSHRRRDGPAELHGVLPPAAHRARADGRRAVLPRSAARRDRRARPDAEQHRRADDAGRRPVVAARRRRRGHPRRRAGHPRRGGDMRGAARARAGAGRERRGRRRGRRRDGARAPRDRRPSSRLRAPAAPAGRPARGAHSRARGRARRERPARAAVPPARRGGLAHLAEAAADERLAADRRGHARPRLRVRGGEGGADPRPHRRPARTPRRGAAAPDRVSARGKRRRGDRVRMIEPEVETRPWDEQTALDDDRYRAQLGYLFERSPFYRAKLAAAGLRDAAAAGGLDAITQLPLTDKRELRATVTSENPFGAHLCAERGEIVRIYSTSGTTGAPSYIPLTAGDLDNWITGSARSYSASGVAAGQRVVSSYNAGPFVAGAALASFDRIGLAHIPIGTGHTDRLLSAIELLRPEAAVLTPSYAAYLLEAAAERGLDLRASAVERVLVAGEPGGGEPGFRALLEEGWGARVTEAMGIGDIGVSLWGECEEQQGMHLGARGLVHAELIDPESGETVAPADGVSGELVLTHLSHRAAPLLRFRTRDHVRLWTSPCRCGRTAPRVRCIGRTDDMLIVRGVNVFPSAVREVVRTFAPAVSGHILVRPAVEGVKQEPPLPVSVELARGTSADDALADAIHARLRSALVVQTRVELVPFGSLRRSEYKSRLVERR